MRCGGPARTSASGTPPGRGRSSPPSAASAKASMSTSSVPTNTPTGSARRTATPSTSGWWTSRPRTTPTTSSTTTRTSAPRLRREVVRQLHHEHVLGLESGDMLQGVRQVELRNAALVVALLRPHEEQNRAGQVLPAQYGIALERGHGEIEVVTVSVGHELVAARVRERPEVGVATRRDVGLGV